MLRKSYRGTKNAKQREFGIGHSVKCDDKYFKVEWLMKLKDVESATGKDMCELSTRWRT